MSLFFGAPGGNNRNSHPFAALAVILLGAVGAALIKAMISRSREYVADADGSRIAGSPYGLASALRKLEAVSRRVPLRNPNPAMNNMFIVEPFLGMESLTNLFASHPPTEKRVAALLGQR
jgi:heat shock protein HtpX